MDDKNSTLQKSYAEKKSKEQFGKEETDALNDYIASKSYVDMTATEIDYEEAVRRMLIDNADKLSPFNYLGFEEIGSAWVKHSSFDWVDGVQLIKGQTMEPRVVIWVSSFNSEKIMPRTYWVIAPERRAEVAWRVAKTLKLI
jgi:hypothetical protein